MPAPVLSHFSGPPPKNRYVGNIQPQATAVTLDMSGGKGSRLQATDGGLVVSVLAVRFVMHQRLLTPSLEDCAARAKIIGKITLANTPNIDATVICHLTERRRNNIEVVCCFFTCDWETELHCALHRRHLSGLCILE